MQDFFTLVGFEFKKILMRKTTLLALLLMAAAALTAISPLAGYKYVEGVQDETKVEAMRIDRDYARALKGPLEETLITQVLEQNAQAMADPANTRDFNGIPSLTVQASRKYERPYSDIYQFINSVYAPAGDTYDGYAIDRTPPADGALFYQKRQQKVTEFLDLLALYDTERQVLLGLNSRITLPLQYDYAVGYFAFMSTMSGLGIIFAFCIAVCAAPLFAGEYSSHVDQLILSSRHGKGRQIAAKLFAGITLALALAAAATGLTLLNCLVGWGFDGASASLQALDILSVYPFTVLQAALTVAGVSVLAMVFASALAIALSAWLRSSFGVIIASALLLFVPMMVKIPQHDRVVRTLLSLFPSNMMGSSPVFSVFLFGVPGGWMVPYLFLPLCCVLGIVLLLPLARWGFRNHQIG